MAVRVKTALFPADARAAFGDGWQDEHFYGTCINVVGRRGSQRTVAIKYANGQESNGDSRVALNQVEFGDATGGVPMQSPAVVNKVVSNGAADRQLVYAGCIIEAVNNIATPSMPAVLAALEGARMAGINPTSPVVVKLIRPPPPPPARGSARSANNRNRQHNWHDDVVAYLDQILLNPSLSNRHDAVRKLLVNRFGVECANDGHCKVPPPFIVAKYMLNAWKKKKKAERDAVQNAVAAAAAGEDEDESGCETSDGSD